MHTRSVSLFMDQMVRRRMATFHCGLCNRISKESACRCFMGPKEWDCLDMPGDNEIECRGSFTFGSACGDCPRCRRVIANGIRPYPEGVAWDEAWRQRQLAEAYRAALVQIAEYGISADRNGGICPYGCDCPHIAQESLKR